MSHARIQAESRMLVLSVSQPQNHPDPKQRFGADSQGNILWPPMDSDGFHTGFKVVPYGTDQALANVALQQGMSPQVAAGLIRNLADRIEKYGHVLLNQTCRNSAGYFDPDGQPMLNSLQLPVDDHGNFDPAALTGESEAARGAPDGMFVLIVKKDGTAYFQRVSGVIGLPHCSLTVSAKAEAATVIQHLRTWRGILADRPDLWTVKPGYAWTNDTGSLRRKRQAYYKIDHLTYGVGKQPGLLVRHGRYQYISNGINDVHGQACRDMHDDVLIVASVCCVPTEQVCDTFDRTIRQLENYPDLLRIPDKVVAVFEDKGLRFVSRDHNASLQQRVKALQDQYDKMVCH